MQFDTMTELIEREFDKIREVRETKGREYAGEEDTLADFKEVADETGTNAFQVWATYVKKHQRAIDTFIREGGVRSESIQSRVMDVIVYHLLLLGLIQDLAETPVENDAEEEIVVEHQCIATWGSYRCALPTGHEGEHIGRDIHGKLAPDTHWDKDFGQCEHEWVGHVAGQTDQTLLQCQGRRGHFGKHAAVAPGLGRTITWET